MQKAVCSTCLLLGLCCLPLISGASTHPNSSRRRYRVGSAYADYDSQENDVIKTGHRKKFRVKISQTPTTSNSTDKKGPTKQRKPIAEPEVDSNTAIKLKWFDDTDRNGDSYISKREYAKTHSASIQTTKMVFRSFDKNNDGFISKNEYLQVTVNSVAVDDKKYVLQKRDCSVELINACAATLIRLVIKGKGKAGCSQMKKFHRCISKKSRSCDRSTRRRLHSIAQEIHKSVPLKRHCKRRLKVGRRNHTRQNQRSLLNDNKNCSPVRVLNCSRVFLQNLAASKSCNSSRQFRNCVRKSHRQCDRSVQKRLRHSVKNVRKTFRRFRECV